MTQGVPGSRAGSSVMPIDSGYVRRRSRDDVRENGRLHACSRCGGTGLRCASLSQYHGHAESCDACNPSSHGQRWSVFLAQMAAVWIIIAIGACAYLMLFA